MPSSLFRAVSEAETVSASMRVSYLAAEGLAADRSLEASTVFRDGIHQAYPGRFLDDGAENTEIFHPDRHGRAYRWKNSRRPCPAGGWAIRIRLINMEMVLHSGAAGLSARTR